MSEWVNNNSEINDLAAQARAWATARKDEPVPPPPSIHAHGFAPNVWSAQYGSYPGMPQPPYSMPLPYGSQFAVATHFLPPGFPPPYIPVHGAPPIGLNTAPIQHQPPQPPSIQTDATTAKRGLPAWMRDQFIRPGKDQPHSQLTSSTLTSESLATSKTISGYDLVNSPELSPEGSPVREAEAYRPPSPALRSHFMTKAEEAQLHQEVLDKVTRKTLTDIMLEVTDKMIRDAVVAVVKNAQEVEPTGGPLVEGRPTPGRGHDPLVNTSAHNPRARSRSRSPHQKTTRTRSRSPHR